MVQERPTQDKTTVKIFFLVILMGTIYGFVFDPLLFDGFKWKFAFYGLVLYCLFSPGVTVFLHRCLTHRAFKAGPLLTFLMGAVAGLNIQNVIDWAAYHRRHHASSDQAGDPHSPIVDPVGKPYKSKWRGLLRSHLSWMLDPNEIPDRERWCKDLLRDSIVCLVDKLIPLWTTLAFVLPVLGAEVVYLIVLLLGLEEFFLVKVLEIAWYSLLWGGIIRLFFTYNVTWSVNSFCHIFGKRKYNTRDFSRNNWLVKILAFGEGEHNSHHRFPNWAWTNLMSEGIPDLSGVVIWTLGRFRLIYDIKRPDPSQRGQGLNAY